MSLCLRLSPWNEGAAPGPLFGLGLCSVPACSAVPRVSRETPHLLSSSTRVLRGTCSRSFCPASGIGPYRHDYLSAELIDRWACSRFFWHRETTVDIAPSYVPRETSQLVHCCPGVSPSIRHRCSTVEVSLLLLMFHVEHRALHQGVGRRQGFYVWQALAVL